MVVGSLDGVAGLHVGGGAVSAVSTSCSGFVVTDGCVTETRRPLQTFNQLVTFCRSVSHTFGWGNFAVNICTLVQSVNKLGLCCFKKLKKNNSAGVYETSCQST